MCVGYLERKQSDGILGAGVLALDFGLRDT
jgi:hypothetical protein